MRARFAGLGLALATLSPAVAAAQGGSFSLLGGLTLPLSGKGPREDVTYSGLFGKGPGLSAQLRLLLGSHFAVSGEYGFTRQPINGEAFATLLDAGELVVKGGDLTRHRLGLGFAWESNTIDGPNLVFKLAPSFYRTVPSTVTVSSPTLGLIQINELDAIGDFGLNLASLVEKTVKKNIALVAGVEVDVIPASDLFSSDETTMLVHMTARLGVTIWF